MEEVNFPRGRVTKPEKEPSKETKSSTSTTNNKKSNRKRSNSNDFLFGAGRDETRKKIKSSSHKSDKERTARSSSTTSSLPLGGGGVLQPIGSAAAKKAAFIEPLSFQMLAKGTKLLGIVREVATEYVVVSLPSMLTGFIQSRDNGIRLDHALSVGMVLSVVVIRATSESVKSNPKSSSKSTVKRRIELTVSPGPINDGLNANMLYQGMNIRGVIKSVEDHGCIVDLSVAGIGGSGCFLKFGNIEGGYDIIHEDDDGDEDMESEGEGKKFKINKGRIYDFTIKSLPNKGASNTSSVIQLQLEEDKTRSKNIIDSSSYNPSMHNIKCLIPGMLLDVNVEHFARNGLCVTFLENVYRGAIDTTNIGGFLPDSDEANDIMKAKGNTPEMWWKSVFVGKNRKVAARLIAIDTTTKVLRLSLLPHVLSLSVSDSSLPSVGSIVKNARVVRLDMGLGAMLALPILEDSEEKKGLYENTLYSEASKIKCAYVHISNAFDKGNGPRTSDSDFNKKFSLSTIVPKLRILSTSNWMDNVASCATAPSIVSSSVLSYADIEPGTIYRSVPVIANQDNGVLVLLGSGIRGFIPVVHLFDKTANGDNSYRNKVKAEKFKVGKKIDVRCLIVNPSERRCVLTAKKTLLSSDTNDPITSYASLLPGTIANGFVTRVTKQGLTITFYNNVFGRASARKLAEELGVENPALDYSIGDVIKARVVNCTRKKSDVDDQNNSYFLELSLNLSSPSESMENSSSQEVSLLHGDECMKPGIVLSAKSMKIVELVSSRPTNNQSFTPGHAVVTIKTKHLPTAPKDTDIKSVSCKLPFELLLDKFNADSVQSAEAFDELARNILKVGKKIAQEGLVVSQGVGVASKPIVSLKPTLIDSAKRNEGTETPDIILPSPSTALFMGAYVQGYCARLDSRYGSFIRFLGGLTGLVPKLKGGLDIGLYDTVLCKVLAIDVMNNKAPKILLKKVSSVHKAGKKRAKRTSDVDIIASRIKLGDSMGDIRVDSLNFARAAVALLDKKFQDARVKARVHVTMAASLDIHEELSMPIKSESEDTPDEGVNNLEKITKYHPFYSWKVGSIIKSTKCVSIDVRDGVTYIELTNRDVIDNNENENPPALFVEEASHLKEGSLVSGVITSISKQNKGIWVQICPGITGFVPGLELSTNIKVLNDMGKYFKNGARINCRIINNAERGQFKKIVRLSVLQYSTDVESPPKTYSRPKRSALVIGRVNRVAKEQRAPSVMIELPGGHLARCDITELEEQDEWGNMPLGRGVSTPGDFFPGKSQTENKSDSVETEQNDEADPEVVDDADDKVASDQYLVGDYQHGLYVQCRVLASAKNILEVSLRESRIEGDLDDEKAPEAKDIVHAYVVSTNRKGCFLRLSRFVEGRAILKELSDSFLPDPVSMFPPGRLIVGKVKEVKAGKNTKNKNGKSKTIVDLDLRESTLLEDHNKLAFEDIKEGEKHRGVVTRIESYGVFVRLNNSQVSGLAHLSECSDDYIKNLSTLYDPGDLVKVLVIKVQKEERRIGFSLKASHFEDDADSDDDSDMSVEGVEGGQKALTTVDDEIDSDDENFASKLASEMNDGKSDESSSESSDDSSSDEDSDDEESVSSPNAIDTDIGFDWGTGTNTEAPNGSDGSSPDSDSDNDSDNETNQNHKSRKRAVSKRQQEKEVSKMEQRLADGEADINPETSADFERIIATDPNLSENWIKYMAYHLSLADIDSARVVANRSFDRIEFREEGEKLNVWTALIALESKYGTTKSLNETVNRASQHNNPKQVYLRTCEMLEKSVNGAKGDATAIDRADEMFAKMCKKFRSKKTVWIAYFKYLLKSARNEEAHKIWKRSVSSLAPHKHIETMSKFAQLEYEFGSPERARTIFDALLDKHPKRMDLLFVYADKEIKHGDLEVARRLFGRTIDPDIGQKKKKYNDKQMKRLFKKWYRMEDEHGDEESQMQVKLAAKEYVERTTKSLS